MREVRRGNVVSVLVRVHDVSQHTGACERRAGQQAEKAADEKTEPPSHHGPVAFAVDSGCPLCHLRQFPRDAVNRIDWSRALADKIIAPRAGPNAKAVDQPVLDLDVPLTSETQPAITSVFPHGSHTQWLACANCHPQLFPQGAKGAAREAIGFYSRGACGACHGSVALGIKTSCERCHPTLVKTSQHETAFDLDIPIGAKSPALADAVFSHKTHRYLECANCHHTLFNAQAPANKVTIAAVAGGKYCAGCHGAVASDLIGQCQRCHADIEGAQ
jgi:c(7)-type cytochrome triheme protein